MRKRFDRFFQRCGSPLLMGVLVASIIASPLADSHPRVGALLALVVLIDILIGATFLGNRRIVVRIALPIAGVWLVARLLEEFGSGHHFYNHGAHVAGFALSCTILWAIFDRLASASQVTHSVIVEAFISYLVIALAFSQVYWMFDDLAPNSFSPAIFPSAGSTFVYFSMTTLTGLGSGGIVPTNPFLRLITAFESMAGLFFIAVVVSRLVASYRRTLADID